MMWGRYFFIIPCLALAGSLAGKKTVPPSPGTFPTTGGIFVVLLVGVILSSGRSPTFRPWRSGRSSSTTSCTPASSSGDRWLTNHRPRGGIAAGRPQSA